MNTSVSKLSPSVSPVGELSSTAEKIVRKLGKLMTKVKEKHDHVVEEDKDDIIDEGNINDELAYVVTPDMTAEQIRKLFEKYENENPPLSPLDLSFTEDEESLHSDESNELGDNYAQQMDVNMKTEKNWNFRAIIDRLRKIPNRTHS